LSRKADLQVTLRAQPWMGSAHRSAAAQCLRSGASWTIRTPA